MRESSSQNKFPSQYKNKGNDLGKKKRERVCVRERQLWVTEGVQAIWKNISAFVAKNTRMIRISWTNLNPGLQQRSKDFAWLDPPMCLAKYQPRLFCPFFDKI